MAHDFDRFDMTIILVYVAGIIAIGIRSGKKSSSEEYFLGGKSMTWPVIGLSMFAANISSNALIAITGGAYQNGISVFNYEWMASVVLVLFAAFILPYYLKSGIYTMPEYFERRFDYRSRLYVSVITLIGNIFIDTAGTLYAGYSFISLFFPETDPYLIITALALFAGSYTILGGLSSVMKTEMVNTLILLGSSLILAIMVFTRIGSWQQLVTSAELKGNTMFHLILPANHPAMPWTGLVLGVPLLGFYFWCNNQFMVQRVLSARNTDEGRIGVLFAGFLKLPVFFLLVLPGIAAIKLFPDLKNSSEAYPSLMSSILPHGLLGLSVVGFLAAMASAVSATLNSAGTLVTMDILRKIYPQSTEKKLVRYGQISTLLFMTIAILWTPNISKAGSLMDYMQSVLALIAPPVVAVFLAGFYFKTVTSNGAFAGLLSGFAGAIILILNDIFHISAWLEMPFLLKAPLLFAVTSGVMILVTWFNKQPVSVNRTISFSSRPEVVEAGKGFMDYRIWGIVLLILTAILVFVFR